MPLDLNRIRVNVSRSDTDAFRYYRQYQQSSSPAVFAVKTVKTRPVLVVSFCVLAGVAVGYSLLKFRESPDGGSVVYETIDKIRSDFAAYEKSLRSSVPSSK